MPAFRKMIEMVLMLRPANFPLSFSYEFVVSSKPPRLILEGIYAFAPNRATMGGTAYFIVEKDSEGSSANLLIDAPANDPAVLTFIEQQGGVRQWVITHRNAAGAAKALQTALHCDVIVQEQEAYLLPEVAQKVPFRDRYPVGNQSEVIWTPGYSPGSCCVYSRYHGGVLFTGRHLLPDRTGHLQPLRFSKTFHWQWQLSHVERLQTEFAPDTLAYVCPGANTGFLRGAHLIEAAYAQLQAINVAALAQAPALL